MGGDEKMDENLINQTPDENNIIDGIELTVEDVQQDIITEENVHEVIVESEEETVIDISESMGWVSGDVRYHDSLLGIDSPRQHPIESITNLREELDKIERLKTVYSDKFNVANYYKWKDAAYDTHGYFVSIVESDKIKICDDEAIFGVVVKGGELPDAGFIGGQDIVPRDNTYGLVVTSGLVDVRCELDVDAGDFVVSNSSGYAKKSASNYGYRVLGTETKDGVHYAVIALGVQADVINALGTDLDATKIKVDANYKNIVSAINVANQAYNKAESAANSASVSKDAVEEALKDILGFGDTLDDVEKTVAASSIISAQAKAIAESAVASAASMKNEAVEKANEALDETTKVRKEFEKSINDVKSDLDNNVRYIDATKESLEGLTKDLEPISKWESPDGTRTGYSGFVAQSDENTTELALVSGYEYKDSNGNVVSTGMAGLVSQVEKNKAEIDLIVSFDQDDAEGVAALVEKVSDHDAQLQTLTSWKTEQTASVSNISQKTNQNSANIDIISEWKNNVEEDVSSIASIKTTANENKASIEQLAQKDGELSTTIAGVKATAETNEASIENLTSWQGKTNIAMASIEQKADANGAYIQSTAANIDKYHVGPNSQAFGFTIEQAVAVFAEDQIYYVPTEVVTEKYKRANEAVEDVDDISTRDISKVYYRAANDTTTYYYYGWSNTMSAYEWLESATLNDIPSYNRTFVPGYLYKWGKINGVGHYGWTTVDKDYKSLNANIYETSLNDDEVEKKISNTSSMSVYFSNTEIKIVKNDLNNNYGYWYTRVSDEDQTIYELDESGTAVETIKYKPNTLYKWDEYQYTNAEGDLDTDWQWVKVDALADNPFGRAISQIRQDANSIAFEVTDPHGSFAGFGARLSAAEAAVQSTASWVKGNSDIEDELYNMATIDQSADKDGSSLALVVADMNGNRIVNGASIVLNQKDGKSYINMDADNINFTASADYSVLSENITLNADRINFTSGNFAIGGTNLISTSDWNTGMTVLTHIANNSKSGSGIVCPGGRTDVPVFGMTNDLNLKPNTNYVVSFVAWIDTSDSNETQAMNCDLYPDTLPEFIVTLTSTPKKFAQVMTSPNSDMNDAVLRFFSNQLDASGTYYAKNTVYITDIKLEEGNVATDWSPAPKDMATAAQLQITNDKISSKVDSTTHQSDLNQLADSMVAKVYNGESLGCSWSITPEAFRVDAVTDDVDGGIIVNKNGLTVTGTIVADYGGIGGWTIDGETIYSKGGSTYSGMSSGTMLSQSLVNPKKYSSVRFYAGSIDNAPVPDYDGDTTFAVLADGSLYAEAAKIKGTITATGGTIGEWTINSSYIGSSQDGGSFYITPASDSSDFWIRAHDKAYGGGTRTFSVSKAGQLFAKGADIEGAITATKGKIGAWNILENGYLASSATSKKDSKIYGIAIDANVENFDGSLNYCPNVFAIGYFSGGTGGTWEDAAFRVKSDGSVHASSVKITGGSITIPDENDKWVELGGKGGLRVVDTEYNDRPAACAQYSAYKINFGSAPTQKDAKDGKNITNTHSFVNYAVMNSGLNYLEISGPIHFANRVDFYDVVQFHDTVYNSGGSAVHTSYREAKYDIENFSDKYSVLFDNLNPVRFKYKNGQSGRYHLGYILDEVKTAMDVANVDTLEFAAYCVKNEQTGEGGIRYEEIVSLNTWQIQKLKPRVTTLEEKVRALEVENAELKEKIDQLLNQKQ